MVPEEQSCSEYVDARVTEGHNPLQPHLRRRAAYILLAVVFALGMMGTTLPTSLYSLYKQKYALTSLTITVIFAIGALAVLLTLVLFGRVSDHFGRRPVIISSFTMAAISALLFIFAQSVTALLLARFISGIGAGLLTGTATAALAELEPTCSPQKSALLATGANMGGFGFGPLVSGLFGQLGPYPTQLVFIVYLVFVFACFGLVGFLPETVRLPDRKFSVRPHVGVPSRARPVFVQAALTVFSVFALLGLFSALASSFLIETLKQHNLIVTGVVVFLLFEVAALIQVGLSKLNIRTARITGIIALLFSLVLIVLGLSFASLTLFIAGAIVGGLGIGLGFMGSLAAVDRVAAPERRGEIVSAFFVAAYSGLIIPVVTVGFLIDATGFVEGTLIFSVAIAILLLGTLAALILFSRRRPFPIDQAGGAETTGI